MIEKKNLWILTEECPTKEIIEVIFKELQIDKNICFFANQIRIIPILDNKDATFAYKYFTFTYEVIGIHCEAIGKIYIKIVSGYSSFVDYLVFLQNSEPKPCDTPIYAIEETKTDDSESRNTGVFQRCSKFVYINMMYDQSVKKIMYYSLKIEQKETPTDTNVFGSRLLATIGVKILGKVLNAEQLKPFSNIQEVIDAKNRMRRPPKGNVPILITQTSDDCIQISGRLYKSNSLSHDPNIGALSIIANVLRSLGWNKSIEITQHGLSQHHIKGKNKFVLIANHLNICLENLSLDIKPTYPMYWKYDNTGEKLASIFIHLITEEFTNGVSIFDNHAGCEKSYFSSADGTCYPLGKYKNRDLYKSGDKSQIIHIPDLIILDPDRKEIINIEGKTYENRLKGISELDNYDAIESLYIKKEYPQYTIERTVVIYGSKENTIVEIQIGFMLNTLGKLVLGIKAPEIFKESINNLFNYWKVI